MKKKLLGEILVEQRLISPEALKESLDTQRVTKETLGTIVIRKKLVSAEKLLQVLAAQKGVSAWFLDRDPAKSEALNMIPPEMCRRYQALPVDMKGRTLVVAMRNPDDVDAIDALRNITGLRIEPVLAEEVLLAKTIDNRLTTEPVRQSGSMDSFVSLAMTELDAKRKASREPKVPTTEAETRPVTGLINEMIGEAARQGATDIHLEPREDRLDVRYRIDGQLVEVRKIPLDLMPMVIARIKIMGECDVVEYRLPQVGRIQFEIDSRVLDLRLSVLPNYHGQRIVLRLLDRSLALRKFSDLGFSAHNELLFRRMISRPYGLVLVTGPTGSGKTTTLYSALNELKSSTNNIMTCEDPVEYAIDGLNQSQVHEKIGLTFASQLRAILRQDPDIVLVGEIRDQETAETAMRASLTGHLVLSTLHCNDAASAIPRLLDMGVEPLMLSTSLVGVVAQRLLRTLCPNCAREGMPDAKTIEAMESLGIPASNQVWKPGGCQECYGTGYRGRVGVHELLPVTDEVSALIASGGTVQDLQEAARPYGFKPLSHDAVERVLSGKTTFKEAQRLISLDNFCRLDDTANDLRLAS